MSTEAQDAAPHDTPDGLDLRGLPRVTPPDPERMSQERAWLSETARRPLFARASAYVRRGGPGYV